MKIGLALSGGGALGAAHLGVLSSLDKNNIHPTHICGTSAGAIIGILYASGGMQAVERFFEHLDEYGIFTLKNIVKSYRTEKIFNQVGGILSAIVKARNFSELPYKFSCVATDISTGKSKIFTSGNPIKCVMASAAYPGVFPMQQINGRHYIDGGVRLNLPITPLKKQGVHFTIASSIYELPRYIVDTKKPKRMQIAVRALDIMQSQINDYELDKADFAYMPPVGQYYWFNFSKVSTIRKIGELHAEQKTPILLKKLEELGLV